MKKWLCLLLAGVLLLSLTACKKQNAAETGNTESIQQQEIGSTQATEQQESAVFAPGSATVTKAVDKTTFTEPVVIPHSQGPILVNPPVFTGIPVTALHNQNAYRFCDGVATVTVNTKDGIRNLEINKAGKIVGNTNQHNYVPKDSLQVKPADIGAEYYAGDGLYAYTDGTLATEGNLPYGVEYLYGLKNEKGQVVVGVQYCGIPAITFRDGYAMVRKPDGTHVMLSKTGQEYGTFTGGHSNGGGTAVVTTGDICHLYDLEGRVISDGYDAIGFVYNGIAPVEIDNKIGFIDAYGKELLEPTIAFDRVIYGKATQEFAVTFADEDAFLLPIGGELAVITLDWDAGRMQKNRSETAYKEFLAGKQGVMQADGKGLFVQDYGRDGINAYAYHDVSGDGIPELFINASHTTILSYQEGNLVEWYTSGSSQPVCLLEDGGVLDVFSNVGRHYTYVSFAANGVATTVSFSEPAGQPTEIWYFQGEKVSETRYAELTKPYLSQKQTQPDWKQWYNYMVEQLPHSYRQVLNNEKMLYVRGQGEMFLKNYLFPPNGDNTDISIGNVTTEDGQKMLAIQQLEGTVILFESNGVVCGNRYGFRGMYDLQVNGVYNWTYTDDEGLHYGVSKLVFEDGKFADVELYRVDQKGLDQVQYTLAGKESNQSTVEAYSATLKSTEVTWVKVLADS